MKILLAGPPGAGKSSQAKSLADRLEVPYVSSSALIREFARKGDPVAERMQDIVSDGSLAPSSAITQLVLWRLSQPDCDRGFVIDGFPRKAEEAASFLGHVGWVDAYILLCVPEPVVVQRIRGRFASGSGRPDDGVKELSHRLSIYAAEHHHVVQVFEDSGMPVFRVDASVGIVEVNEAVDEILGIQSHEIHFEAVCR